MKFIELFKTKKYIGAAAVLVVGIIVMLASGVKSEPSKQAKTGENPVYELEKRLEETLSTIMGAGKVDVFIMLDDFGTKGYVQNTKQIEKEESSEIENETVIGGGSGGAPILSREQTPAIRGVIITAEGAGNEVVKKRIADAAEAALAVMPHRIEVVERRK